MWIRSQNKYCLMNCKNVMVYENIKMNIVVIITNDGTDVNDGADVILGTYSTKEKALKVLDQIVEEINYGDLQNVFVMPQDDEVKDEI